MSVSIAPSPFGSLSVSVAETGSTLDVSVLSTSNCVLTMELGVPGPQGEPGEPGAAGQGVPAGGSAGQVLAKVDGVDYNTEWVNVSGNYLPLAGGAMDVNALVTFSNGAQNSEIGGWGFGVADTATPGHYATVEPQAFTVTDGTTSIVVTPTGITFPDSTVQTTAWTGGSFRTLNDYDFTNVPDTRLNTYGITLTGPTNDPIPYNSYLIHNGLVFNQDSTDGGIQEGVQYQVLYGTQNIYGKSRQLVDVDGTLTWQNEVGYVLSGGDAGLKFLQYSGAKYTGSIQYQRSQITFGDNSVQTTAFPGFTGYAPLASPAFTGNPTAPTPTAGDNDTSISTTAFVTTAVTNGLAGGTAIAKNIETEVRNQSGSTMAAGTIVYISGATGNKPLITKAQANNDANSAQTIGFVKTSIANNGTGYVITRGSLENIDTSALTEGVQLYLSPSTAGGWTTTKPYAPDHLVYVGIVIRSHPTLGIIYVSVQNGYEVAELHDVSAQTPSNLDLLSYNSSTSLWQNSSFSTLGLLTSATAASTYQTQAGMSSYLTTATAASTYQTQAGMSSYATLSSPTFSGSPSLPTGTTAVTQSAGNSTTAVATTAFVTAAVPAFATNAQIVTGTSTTTTLAPGNAGFFLANPKLRSLAAINSTSISGSGAITANSGYTFLREAYLTALSVGRASYGIGIAGTAGFGGSTSNFNQINFSNKVWMSGYTNTGNSGTPSYLGDSNTIVRVTLGGYSTATTGDMTQKGIGWKKVGGVSSFIVLTVHNGTTLTDVTTSTAVADGAAVNWQIYSDGSGNVTLYINGSQAATTSAGPTGLTTSLYSAYREQVEATVTPAVRHAIRGAGGWLYLD